jgi:hypothetical protein
LTGVAFRGGVETKAMAASGRRKNENSAEDSGPAGQQTMKARTEAQRQLVDGKWIRRELEEAELVLRHYENLAPSYRRIEELKRQKVRLGREAIELEYLDAAAILSLMQTLQVEEPNQFAALVRIVRPQGATRRPESSIDQVIARAGLKESGFLMLDGLTADRRIVAVLDATFTEQSDGVTLRKEGILPHAKFLEELAAAEEKLAAEVVELARQDVRDDLRKQRGDDPDRSR